MRCIYEENTNNSSVADDKLKLVKDNKSIPFCSETDKISYNAIINFVCFVLGGLKKFYFLAFSLS